MSHASLNGLDRVLDAEQETAAAVDRDGRFPRETVDALADVGAARAHAPRGGRRAGGGPSSSSRRRAAAARARRRR